MTGEKVSMCNTMTGENQAITITGHYNRSKSGWLCMACEHESQSATLVHSRCCSIPVDKTVNTNVQALAMWNTGSMV